MKKLLLGLAATAAIATPFAVAGTASAAGVARCQETVVTSTATEAQFDTIQPAGAYGQWDNVWAHHYTVTVQPNGAFTGIGFVSGNDGTNTFDHAPETITGEFIDGPDADTVSDQVTFTATRTGDGVAYTLTNALLGGDNISVATITVGGAPFEPQQPVEFKVTMPSFITVTDGTGVTDFANHGEYVTAMGGGKIAAQSCVGMPLTSNKNK